MNIVLRKKNHTLTCPCEKKKSSRGLQIYTIQKENNQLAKLYLKETVHFFVVVDRNVMFFAGAILAVLVILTVVDEDVLNVEHVLSIITVLGISCLFLRGRGGGGFLSESSSLTAQTLFFLERCSN